MTIDYHPSPTATNMVSSPASPSSQTRHRIPIPFSDTSPSSTSIRTSSSTFNTLSHIYQYFNSQTRATLQKAAHFWQLPSRAPKDVLVASLCLHVFTAPSSLYAALPHCEPSTPANPIMLKNPNCASFASWNSDSTCIDTPTLRQLQRRLQRYYDFPPSSVQNSTQSITASSSCPYVSPPFYADDAQSVSTISRSKEQAWLAESLSVIKQMLLMLHEALPDERESHLQVLANVLDEQGVQVLRDMLDAHSILNTDAENDAASNQSGGEKFCADEIQHARDIWNAGEMDLLRRMWRACPLSTSSSESYEFPFESCERSGIG